MRFEAEIVEVWLEGGLTAGRISCPTEMRFTPGQYLLAYSPADMAVARAEPVFPTVLSDTTLHLAPSLPQAWFPGTELVVRGPLGNGFRLPEGVSHLALAVFGATPSRLLPLARQALSWDGAVTLFCDLPPAADLPAALEVYPLQELPGMLDWADFLAIDIPLVVLPDLRPRLGLAPTSRLRCAAQVLVQTSLLCGGAGVCGICSVPAHKGGWKHACVDGPVFDLDVLDW